MDIQSDPDDRNVLLESILALTSHNLTRFVVIAERKDGIATFYSNEEKDAVELLDKAKKLHWEA